MIRHKTQSLFRPILLLLGILWLAPVRAYAQNQMSIGVFCGPSYPFIKPNPLSTSTYSVKSGTTISIEPMYAYSKKWSVGLGLTTTNIRYTNVFHFKTMHPRDPNIPDYTQFNARLNEVSLISRHKRDLNGKFNVIFSQALGITQGINVEELTVYRDGSSRPSQYLRDFNLAAEIGLGLQWSLNQTWSVLLDTRYRLFVYEHDVLSMALPSQLRPLFGVNYRFKIKQQ